MFAFALLVCAMLLLLAGVGLHVYTRANHGGGSGEVIFGLFILAFFMLCAAFRMGAT